MILSIPSTWMTSISGSPRQAYLTGTGNRIYVFCSCCQVKSLVAAVIKREKKTDAVNDLSGAEVARFQHIDIVDGDDMLDMREFLKGFNGDFSSLFQKNKS